MESLFNGKFKQMVLRPLSNPGTMIAAGILESYSLSQYAILFTGKIMKESYINWC